MSGLKRYTELPFLLHMLRTRQLTLLSTDSWVDRNDASFIEMYKERKALKTVLALCLTKASATYHHWKVFAGNSSGVRIEFHESAFLSWADSIQGLTYGPVRYWKLDPSLRITVEELPFAKRHAFRDEDEFRLIYAEANETLVAKPLDLDLGLIKGIVVSPWLPPPVFRSIEATIKSIDGCSALKIRPTTMLANEIFMGAGRYDA